MGELKAFSIYLAWLLDLNSVTASKYLMQIAKTTTYVTINIYYIFKEEAINSILAWQYIRTLQQQK